MGAKKRWISNKAIIIIKISAACILFFCCCFFFFSNLRMFKHDITSWMAFFPIIFFAGVVLICIYISVLVGALESKSLVHSDRYDIAYRAIFTLTFILLVVRAFFGDFMAPPPDPENLEAYIPGTNLNVPITIVVLAIISGLVTIFTPKIKDNDSVDF